MTRRIKGSILVDNEIGIGAVSVSETELGILEGATVTTTEFNYVMIMIH